MGQLLRLDYADGMEILYTKGNSVMDHGPMRDISEGLIDGQDSPARPTPSVPPIRWIKDECMMEGGLSNDSSPWLGSAHWISLVRVPVSLGDVNG